MKITEIGKMHAAFGVFLCLAATVLAGHAQEEDYPPGTFQLAPQVDLHLQPTRLMVPNKYYNDFRPVGHNITLNLPPGFRVRLFAASRHLHKTRFMAFSPEGVLHVASLKRYTLQEANSEIIAFPDRDKDGVADEAIVAASDLEMAHSLAFYQDAMYVAEAHQITRFRDRDRDGVYEEREVLVDDIPYIEGSWHTTRTIVIDAVNEKIFVGVGSPCDLCRSEKPFSGGSLDPLPPNPEWGSILQFNIDGTGRRIYARGMRNTVGLTLHPVTNELWGTHNGHDREGAHLPPEWIDIIRDGGFMGYPFVYGYQVPVNFNIGLYQDVGILPLTQQDNLLIQSQQRPVALVPAHLAPMGIHFYTGDLFPAKYYNAAFVALRGGQTKGNLALVPGFKVVALFCEPDGSRAHLADFLTGFGTDAKGSSVWGKPVGITSDGLGNLYVSSDQVTNGIFRLEPGPLVGSFEHNLPDTIANGSALSFEATIHLSRIVAAGEAPTLTADLSPFGGSAAEPFTALEDGFFHLEIPLEIAGPIGPRPLIVRAEQRAGGETHVLEFLRQLVILPGVDIEILNGALSAGWRVETAGGARVPELEGDADAAFQVGPESFGIDWTVDFVPSAPVDALGYTCLRFAFRAEEISIPRVPQFLVHINGLNVDLVRGEERFRLDFEQPEWQIVEIPMEEFTLETGTGYPNRVHRLDEVALIDAIRFIGNVAGTFYLDDIRLVAGASATALPTLVQEVHEDPLPGLFSLEQNYPNPFNSDTAIGFSLPASGAVELAIYNLAGQQVALLVRGVRAAGVHAVYWDGRNGDGARLASGLYFYRLRSGTRAETRKLLLLQ